MLYFDHNATTPGRPEALEVAAEVEREAFGNPSSLHGPGRRARAVLEESRETLAAIWRARAAEIVFTSGGTEANRLAIEGALEGVLAAAGSGGARSPHAVPTPTHRSPARTAAATRLEARVPPTATRSLCIARRLATRTARIPRPECALATGCAPRRGAAPARATAKIAASVPVDTPRK